MVISSLNDSFRIFANSYIYLIIMHLIWQYIRRVIYHVVRVDVLPVLQGGAPLPYSPRPLRDRETPGFDGSLGH